MLTLRTIFAMPILVSAIVLSILLLDAPVALAKEKRLPGHPNAVWVLVDTEDRTLDIFQGDKLVLRLDRIAIGSKGAAPDRRRGDNKTPIGRYRVSRIDTKSKFHIFIGLDYPSRLQVDRALRNKLITTAMFHRIREAVRDGQTPPQDTPLGGDIGIHGIGAGDIRIHSLGNWTQGCVALTNEQVDKLYRYVKVGTVVVIR